ncbi:MAG: fatty acid desaturase family protein, partial [Pseudomonadota bacterium]
MTDAAKLADALSKDELRRLSTPSAVKATLSLIGNWAMIVGAFTLAIVWPNPLTILASILLLGGRQLGLAVLNHDCAHNAFYKSQRLNDFVGHWLTGGPINVSVYAYRAYHLKHHKYAGTKEDPDLTLVKGYPVTRDSLRRKFIRDFTGQTGVRDTIYELKKFRLPKHAPWLAFHVVLLASLAAVGALWAYALWWAARLFAYPAIVRLRLIGEHGVAINRLSSDPRENTGTTRANWIERIFIAPNSVNFHLEHHHFAAVPGYNLPEMHRLLSSRG